MPEVLLALKKFHVINILQLTYDKRNDIVCLHGYTCHHLGEGSKRATTH
jgi:hypothetical protein